MNNRTARALILAAVGALGAMTSASPPVSAKQTVPGTLFVSNYSGNQITVYPVTADGDTLPGFTIATLSGPHQIAWVYDPHTDEEGCFGWVNAKVEKLSGIRFGYLQSVDQTATAARDDEAEDDGPAPDSNFGAQSAREQKTPAWIRWTGPVLICFAVALLSAAGGYIFGGRQVAGQVERELSPTLAACQQIADHPVEACRDILQHFAPPVSGAAAPADAQSEIQPEHKPAQKQGPAGEKGNNGKHK